MCRIEIYIKFGLKQNFFMFPNQFKNVLHFLRPCMQNDSKRPGCAGHITHIKDITYYHQSAKKCHKQGNLLLLHLQQIGKTFGEETLPKILIFYRIP